MDNNCNDIKKALIITDVTAPGGVDTYIVDMVEFAKNKGWEIAVLMDDMPGSDLLYKTLSLEGIRIKRKGLYHRTNTINEIAHITQDTLKEYNPNIVHVVCGSPRSAIVPRKVVIDMNYPLFFTEQYVDPNIEFTPWQHEQVGIIYNGAAGIITVCEENKILLEETYNLKNEKTIVIPNSINLEKIKAQKQLEIKEFYNALCVGRLTPQKGFDILIKSVSLLDKQHQQRIKITLFGDGPDKDMLKNMAHELGVEALFEFLGWVSNVGDHIINYDLFLMPSRFEGQPFALIEAMAHGLPCIASAVSGIPELFNYGENGTLIESESPKSISNTISEFMDDPSPFFIKTTAALGYIRENHNLLTNMTKVIDLWTSTTNNWIR